MLDFFRVSHHSIVSFPLFHYFLLLADEVVEQIVETLQDFFGDYSQVCGASGVQMMRGPSR
jgi:hypothetical protein